MLLCSVGLQRRVFFLVAAFVVLMTLGTGSAVGQSSFGQVVVTVRQLDTRVGIDLARILLSGPAVLLAYSNADGIATYDDVPPGVYTARVTAKGFKSANVAQFEVSAGHAVAVDLALARSAEPKLLGTVNVTSRPSTVSEIRSADPRRAVSDSLAGALLRLPNVSPGFAGFGRTRNPFSALSINGESPGDTGISVDGLPFGLLSGPGAGIEPDLFSAVAVEDLPHHGATGGAINFVGLEPTIAWQGSLAGSYGTYQKSSAVLTERGTLGNVGVVAVYANRTINNPLNGLRFLDESGLNYRHDGSLLTEGAYVKMRSHFSAAHTLTSTLILGDQSAGILCTSFTTNLPCGYGPGNRFTDRESAFQVGDSAVFGNMSVIFKAFVNTGHIVDDERLRIVNFRHYPFATDQRYVNRSFAFDAQRLSKGKHSLSASGFLSNIVGTYVAQPTRFFPSATQRFASHFFDWTLSDGWRVSHKVTLSGGFGATSIERATWPLEFIRASYAPTVNDSVDFSAQTGSGGASATPLGQIDDPAAVEFNCVAALAYTNGPGDASGPSRERGLSLSLAHRWGPDQVGLFAYRKVENGGLVNAIMPATIVNPSSFPSGYLDDINAIYEAPSGCGARRPLTLSDLIVAQPVSVTRRVYEGYRVTGTFALGPALTLQPYFVTQVAKAVAGDARVTEPSSVIRLGAQLPNVPLHRAGLAIALKSSPRLQLFVDGAYVSSNNSFNLPAYATLAAAARIAARHSVVTISATNLLNTLASPYATSRDAVPVQTVSGTLLATVAQHLQPREINLSVTFPTGRTEVPISAIAPPDQDEGQEVHMAFQPLPLPETPPHDPFALAVTSPSCAPENARAVKPVLAALAQYVARIEGARASGNYPANFPAMPTVNGFSATYHKHIGLFALEIIVPDDPRQLPFASCAQIHFADEASLRAHGLYLPSHTAVGNAYYLYAPAVGIYLYLTQVVPPQNRVNLFPLPSLPLPDPFALEAGRCPAAYRPIAEHLLNSLKAYVSAPHGSTSPSPQGWTVTPHHAAAGEWLSLSLSDPETEIAVLSCAHVSAGTRTEIESRGFRANPGLNYARPLGLYELTAAP